MSLYRSEDMTYARVTMAQEVAHATLRELGTFAKFHLVDLMEDALNPSDMYMYQKKRVVACHSWERKLASLAAIMEENGVKLPNAMVDPVPVEVEDVVTGVKNFLVPLEEDLNRNIEYKDVERKTMFSLKEHRIVLQKLKYALFQGIQEVFALKEAENNAGISSNEVELDRLNDTGSGNTLTQSLLASDYQYGERKSIDEGYSGPKFHNYICGTIPVIQQGLFERMLFRVSRGNAYVRFETLEDDVEDPTSGESMRKAVFYVVYIGRTLEGKITRMLDYFRALPYQVPDSPDKFDAEVINLQVQINEKQKVLDQTQTSITSTLNTIAWGGSGNLDNRSPMKDWAEALRRERSVCDALRKCRTVNTSSMVTAEGWVPVEDMEAFRDHVQRAARPTGATPGVVQQIDIAEIKERPPTYFKLNKFTSNFQGIVNTYGVPRYKEVNPGLFTVVTFPFLFGVMYGDIGHGTIMTLFGLLMVLKEDKLAIMKKLGTLGEIPTMMFGGRYLILLMGIFAVYCGTVYNDCLSVPINAFGSGWEFPEEGSKVGNTTEPIEAFYRTKVYPYGVDPNWYHTNNELTYFNSLKMKISVTFGVVQMTFGIILSLMNHLYFNDYVSVFCEFIPQMIFMMSTFGYMIFLVVFKFTIDWANSPHKKPPSLIQVMINMFLKPGSVPADEELYAGQASIQTILVLLAVVSIPWMLFPKPYLEKWKHEKKMREGGYGHLNEVVEDSYMSSPLMEDEKEEKQSDVGHHHEEEEEFEFSEHFIHQAIHTIEFVLGAVSNTASYLRLWALSLAHAELANVFWEKLIMEFGVKEGNPVFIFVTFAAWAGATFAVLLCMDSLECFLHALRLHWVEFQNKFFNADGYAFEPFSYEEKEE